MGAKASKLGQAPTGKKASRKPSVTQPEPDSPLEFVLDHWKEIPDHELLSRQKLQNFCRNSWPSFTANVPSELRWPPEGSFNMDCLNSMRKHLMEGRPPPIRNLGSSY